MRGPTEMELRVSAAIDSRIEAWFGDRLEANLNTLDLARAAIRAMRDYTPDMYNAGCAAFSECPSDSYQAMIDAASPEEA